MEQLLDRITQTDVASVAAAYERRIRNREAQRQEIEEKIANCGRPLRDFDGSLDHLEPLSTFSKSPGICGFPSDLFPIRRQILLCQRRGRDIG